MRTEAALLREFSAAHQKGARQAEQARRTLLCEASRTLEPAAFARLIERCYRRGDVNERCAVLRALPGLDHPERHVAIAAEGVRTNVVPVFEAIAADNPYPAAHFSDPQLDQMVIKAIFFGVPVARIVGLEARMNDALRRMAADFASERRAAGRSVPADAVALAEGRLPGRRSA